LNNPEYIVVDELGAVVEAVKTALDLGALNYQYGYVEELNQTLTQWAKDPEYSLLRFPLVWVMQPFTIVRGKPGIYGSVEGLRIFIIQSSQKTLRAAERMEGNFKEVIYPIYRELLNQLNESVAFVDAPQRKHRFTDRYYWGEAQQSVLSDVVDCSEISNLELDIHNNQNCPPFKSF
jgi:hypothetical protein